MDDETGTADPEQVRVRKDKRERLLAAGVEPYPVQVPVTASVAQVRQEHADLEAGQETDAVVGVAGRVVHLRNTGKLCFASIADGEGRTLQIMLSLAEVGQDALAAFKTDVDLGDFLFASGRVISSRRGELSVMATSWQLASKALRPLPTMHKETSEETRVRRRYLDLIARPDARDMVRTRAAVMRSLRESFHARGYLEVETPTLQTIAGGAAARPFTTHMNAFDVDLYLRIATELFLKQAVVGGVERVYEIGRNFRNEGVDSSHSPEFSAMEAYEAWTDYNGIAAMTQGLVQEAAQNVFGTTTVTLADGSPYEVGGEWAQISLYHATSEALGEEITPQVPLAQLQRYAEKLGLDVSGKAPTPGKVVEELFEHLVGDHLVAPTFVRDFPVDTSPLTRAHRTLPGVTEKWDLYIRGFELATGYSELVDPVVQRERFEAQALLAAAGDPEAMLLDEDFLRAVEHALPPMGGMGMGVDRLLMALTGRGIRETILFPLVKPAATGARRA
nr:lysine--tRNA ligase [Litorihabitans aurantiacus]